MTDIKIIDGSEEPELDPYVGLSDKDLQDCSKEMSTDDLERVLSTTIISDRETKVILFLATLLNYTEQEQQNLGFTSPSSSGKSYIALEVTNYFPNEDIQRIHYASPQAFFHQNGVAVQPDGETPLESKAAFVSRNLHLWEQENPRPEHGEIGDWREQRKEEKARLREEWESQEKGIRIDLERKIIIFLDQPNDQLLQRLRPMLSHDEKVGKSQITDKSKQGQNQTKTVFLVGYPTFIFLTTRFSTDEQERNRMFLLSASTTQNKIRGALKLLGKKLANREHYQSEIESNKERRKLMVRIREIRDQGIADIVIPNSLMDEILNKFLTDHPTLVPRLTRDYPRLIALIKGHALVNCFNRETEGDRIIADRVDAFAGYDLYTQIAESNERGLPPSVWNFWTDVIRPAITDVGLGFFDLRKLHMQYFGSRINNHKLRYMVDLLIECGLVYEEKDPNDRRRTLVFLSPEDAVSPPEPEQDEEQEQLIVESHTERPQDLSRSEYKYLKSRRRGTEFSPAEHDSELVMALIEKDYLEEAAVGDYRLTRRAEEVMQ